MESVATVLRENQKPAPKGSRKRLNPIISCRPFRASFHTTQPGGSLPLPPGYFLHAPLGMRVKLSKCKRCKRDTDQPRVEEHAKRVLPPWGRISIG
jgi:hypothetical protein